MNKTYAYHKPTAEGIEKIAKLRKAFSDLHDVILENAVESRERSVAFTHLEEASHWAIKSVVINDPGSTVDPDATFGTLAEAEAVVAAPDGKIVALPELPVAEAETAKEKSVDPA